HLPQIRKSDLPPLDLQNLRLPHWRKIYPRRINSKGPRRHRAESERLHFRRRRWLFLQALERVADRGGFFVIFAADGVLESVLQFFLFGNRAGFALFAAQFVNPAFEALDFATLLDQVRPAMLAIKRANLLKALFHRA